MTLIIATTLAKKSSAPCDATEGDVTHRGCMTSIPNRDANAPVRKGRNAEPACPNPAIHPMLPDRSQGGSTFREWFITRGYMGPKSIPTPETATAPPTRDGTNQTTSSNLNS